MGRLTDNILAVIGEKPSDRVVLANQGTLQSSSKENNMGVQPVEVMGTSLSVDGAPSTDTPSSGKDNKDCYGCKFVTVGVCCGTSGYVAYLAWKAQHKFTGMKKVAYLSQAFIISSSKTFFTEY